MRQLPKTVYIAWANYENEKKPFLSLDVNPNSLIEGDGPTMIGTYQLTETRTLVKCVEERGPRRRTRTRAR